MSTSPTGYKNKIQLKKESKKNMIWNRGKTIGRGGFGLVSIANVQHQTGDQFPPIIAVKTAKVSASNSLVEEKKLLDLFKECPCILHCFGDDVTTEENEELYNIELEYASGGCLADRKGLPDNIVRQHTKSILIALSHVHKLGYVHCDVKPHNVLLVADSLHSRNKGIGEIAKLADFGSAKNIKDDQDNKEFRGTVLYAAPESIIHQEYQPESDIWALGCTVLHMITGKSPWKVEKRAKAEDVLYKIGCSHELPDIPSKASKEAKDFLKKCLIKNPKERWTADMLLSHPFLASIVEWSPPPPEDFNKTHILSESEIDYLIIIRSLEPLARSMNDVLTDEALVSVGIGRPYDMSADQFSEEFLEELARKNERSRKKRKRVLLSAENLKSSRLLPSHSTPQFLNEAGDSTPPLSRAFPS
ncbi:mitogen-activated protein kinase kinase kinase 19 [Abeliophyllum distichum]|uniref:Mitogen-activated protein kinase kinase kinase 19 n=1 Tax=Abeliophyllum distichum TaxID=126358 RepID=A0ABD1P587_9LAMI